MRQWRPGVFRRGALWNARWGIRRKDAFRSPCAALRNRQPLPENERFESVSDSAMKNMHSSSPSPWRPSSQAVEASQIEDVIAGDKVMVHFWAPWNPHDKGMDANIQAVKGKFPRVRFYSVNADETAFEPFIETHHVAAFPALVCFANGRARGRFYGVETVEKLEAFVREMVEMPGR